ncbi:2-polyprenylphenol 6-hydroxylase [Ferrovibrio sp.]|uniref:2-polyprenylphenol 6-hydroxylase n=1 Tax=Ferrovibrio sp. TaxID=1917215 RepID=UPI002606C88B|nr:2-polyprenylphenol 6-hydroxylase [Ferrovibrio sp.]
MLTDLRHLLRLFAIGRCFARQDALFLLREAPVGAGARSMLGLFQTLFGRRRPDLREGERLAAALSDLGPSFIKLGQVLSVRPDLVGATLAGDLGRLRDKLPPFPWAEAKAVIEAELGAPTETLFAHIETEPVAAASVAQVHLAETSDGKAVAVKVLRPGVEAAFAEDLALFAWLAEAAERHVAGLDRLRPRDVVASLRDWVAIELDLRLEAAAAGELRDNFRDDADVLVPAIDWQRTARRVMTVQRIAGIPIEDRAALQDAGLELHDIAARVIRVFLKQALRDGYFHADMHHGNLFVSPGQGGRLELVDFGIMGRLDMKTRRFMAEMLGAFLTGNWRRAAEVHFEAGYVPGDRDVNAFAQACRSIGEPILDRPVTEISIGRLLAQLFQITETFGMRTQTHLLLLQKTMVTVEGVARSLDPEINFWEVARPVIEDWARDNLGPAARLREAGDALGDALRRLPTILDGLDALAAANAEGGLRLSRDSLALLAEAQATAAAKRQRPLLWSIWAGIAALLAAALLLAD